MSCTEVRQLHFLVKNAVTVSMQWFVVEICLRLFFSSIFPAIPGGRLICIRDISNFIYHCEHSRDFTDMETKSLVCSSPEINSAQKKKRETHDFSFRFSKHLYVQNWTAFSGILLSSRYAKNHDCNWWSVQSKINFALWFKEHINETSWI